MDNGSLADSVVELIESMDADYSQRFRPQLLQQNQKVLIFVDEGNPISKIKYIPLLIIM